VRSLCCTCNVIQFTHIYLSRTFSESPSQSEANDLNRLENVVFTHLINNHTRIIFFEFDQATELVTVIMSRVYRDNIRNNGRRQETDQSSLVGYKDSIENDMLFSRQPLLPDRRNLLDAESLHIYFYESLQSAKVAAKSLSAAKRQKLLNQEIRHQDVSSVYGRGTQADEVTSPLSGGSNTGISSTGKRKQYGIFIGWGKLLVNSPFNDKKFIHSLFYDKIEQATATGASLSQIRFDIVSQQKDSEVS
jgi:hypothetical protein